MSIPYAEGQGAGAEIKDRHRQIIINQILGKEI
jgi:hypothetical protein